MSIENAFRKLKDIISKEEKTDRQMTQNSRDELTAGQSPILQDCDSARSSMAGPQEVAENLFSAAKRVPENIKHKEKL